MAIRCGLTSAFDLPLFLAPAFADVRASIISRRSFASSSAQCQKVYGPIKDKKINREKNKKRGVSAIRSTGPRVRLEVEQFPLPVPAEDALERRKQFKMNEKHGLWGFFNGDKKAMVTAEDEAAFGRPWTYQELSVKDWDDLYKLHWSCILEMNRTLTRGHELKRLRAGYGANENEERKKAIQATLNKIKKVLTHRHLNYVEANNVLKEAKDVRELLADDFEEQEEEYSDLDDAPQYNTKPNSTTLEVDDTWPERTEPPPAHPPPR